MEKINIQLIPINFLVEHPENSNFMKGLIADRLRNYIEKTGRYEPLTVRRHPDEEDKFQVINGHNRLRILRSLNYHKVNCIIWNLDDNWARLYLATLNRLSGQDIPERRAILLDNLLQSFELDELSTLLPDDKKQLEELKQIGRFEIETYSKSDTFNKAYVMPVILTFSLDESEVKELNLALDMILKKQKRDLTRSQALVYLARNYIRGLD